MTETRAKYETLRGNQNAAKDDAQKTTQKILMVRLYHQDEINLAALLAAGYAANASAATRKALADAVEGLKNNET